MIGILEKWWKLEVNTENGDNPDIEEVKSEQIYSLEDDLMFDPVPWKQSDLLNLMIILHRCFIRPMQTVYPWELKAQQYVLTRNGKKLEAWITEFGLYRLVTMISQAKQEEGEVESMTTTWRPRHHRIAVPNSGQAGWGGSVEESWDLHALGKIAAEILSKMGGDEDRSDWQAVFPGYWRTTI